MQHDLFIDGTWHRGAHGTFLTVDPATGRPLAEVACAGPADVANAVAVARAAVADGRWAYMPSSRRAQVLYQLAQLVQERGAEIARWETLDTGVPITVTRLFAVPSAVESIRHAATTTVRFNGGPARGPRAVAVVVDHRFPLTALVREVLTALVAGDAVVVAPSAHAPLTALLLAELTAEAGLPSGVLGVVTGGPEVADELAGHPGIDRVVAASFAGTTKATAVVAEDADIDDLLSTNPLGGLCGVGRYFTGYRHVDVHTSRATEFLTKLTAAVVELRLGHGRETDTECGPLGSRADLDGVDGYVRAALAVGARAVTGGVRPDGPLSQGWFFQPTILFGGDLDGPDTAGVAPDAPVVRVSTWRDHEELRALRPTGLWQDRVSVWSDDLPAANRLATLLQAGQVYVNSGPVVETDTVWQTRGTAPRPLNRESGLIPRGPGSRRTPPPASASVSAPGAEATGEPVTTADVPAPWGEQVSRFVSRTFGVDRLSPVKWSGGGHGRRGLGPGPAPRRAG